MECAHRNGGQYDPHDQYQCSPFHSTQYYDEGVTRLHRTYDETVAGLEGKRDRKGEKSFVPDVLTAGPVPDNVAANNHRFRRSQDETNVWRGSLCVDAGGTGFSADRRRSEFSRCCSQSTGRVGSVVSASHRREGPGRPV